ncbi:MAG: response regulator [Candidatus Thiodiazotropha sp. (ex Monitilora ramsayi)]|nr:response regulator [Candidatus Thiodiazotropha sp. (ex Monitilora ramsayi)]
MPKTENHPADLTAEFQALMQKIEANWPISPSGIWNSSSIRQLSRYLHDFTRRCEETGQLTLLDLITEIDEMTDAVIDSNSPPSDQQIDTLNESLVRLKDHVSNSTRVDPKPSDQVSPFDLLYLPHGTDESDPIAQAIEVQPWRHRTLASLDELSTTLSQEGAKVALIDVAYLDQDPLDQTLKSFGKNKNRAQTELLFISEHGNMETRLSVMRTGARHFFTKPINTDDLIDTIEAQINPRTVPRHRVLIVEDDESQANFAAKLLQKSGMETLAIYNPLSVIEGVTQFQPDLILMDLYMPGADGIELTRLIRDREETQAIPIVFLSGENDPEKKLLALYAGADDFLTKPVRPQQLLATVNTRIERAKNICTGAARQLTDPMTGLPTRRQLLSQIDLMLSESGTYRSILVCCLDDSHDEVIKNETRDAFLNRVVNAIKPLLRHDDTLARSGNLSLAILFQRGQEHEVEQLGEAVYSEIFQVLDGTDHAKPGIGIALIDSTTGGAHEQLGHAESSARFAYRRGVAGYQLYGEAPPASSEPNEQPVEPLPREKFLTALEGGLVTLQEQRYMGRHELSPATIEMIPELEGEANSPYQVAANAGATIEFDRFICEGALQKLGQLVMQGSRGRLIFRQSVQVIKEIDYLDFIKSELRRRQIVGTGLVIEFDLPSLAADLKQARTLIGELTALGISVSLDNFACNETAYKVLAYLEGNAVRPHLSLLKIDSEKIQHIASQIHSLGAEIILPRVEHHGQIGLQWSESADYIQADFAN